MGSYYRYNCGIVIVVLPPFTVHANIFPFQCNKCVFPLSSSTQVLDLGLFFPYGTSLSVSRRAFKGSSENGTTCLLCTVISWHGLGQWRAGWLPLGMQTFLADTNYPMRFPHPRPSTLTGSNSPLLSNLQLTQYTPGY